MPFINSIKQNFHDLKPWKVGITFKVKEMILGVELKRFKASLVARVHSKGRH